MSLEIPPARESSMAAPNVGMLAYVRSSEVAARYEMIRKAILCDTCCLKALGILTKLCVPSRQEILGITKPKEQCLGLSFDLETTRLATVRSSAR